MNIDIYTGGMAATNAYLVEIEGNHILFDAPEGVFEWLKKRKISITHLILTHQHWDHIHDAGLFSNIEIIAFDDKPREELTLIESFKSRYNLPLHIEPYKVNRTLSNKEQMNLHGSKFQALHAPGHSPDSLAYYNFEENMCISGDVIFSGSCGRVDLPGGSHEELVKSIENVIFKLPGETTLFTGHGPETSVEEELANNPYKSF